MSKPTQRTLGELRQTGFRPRTLREEIRSHLLAYIAAAVFWVLGPVLARMIFPEAPTSLVLFGGIAFGVHFAFCALADKFFE